MARLLLRDLTPGTAYKLQLRAADGDSFSDWSRLFNLATSSDVTAPDVPAWATAGTEWVVNGDTFVATWVALNMTLPNNVDFDHYELELTDGVKTIVIATNNTSYTLTYDQNRVYFGSAKATVQARVRSVDHVGNASAWSAQKSATNPAPGNVASIATTALLESIKIDWPAVSDLDLVGYKVQVSTTSASTGFTDIYNGPNLSVLHGTVQFATDHWFRVYAVDKFGSISAAPVTSSAVRPKSSFTVDTTAPNTPTSLAAVLTNNANGIGARAAVTWNLASPPTDLAGFYVRYRKVGDTVWAVASFPSDNTGVAGSFAGTINVDSAYVNYEFAIKAYDWSNNESAWSSTVTATSPGNAIPANVTGLVSSAGNSAITYSWNPVADLDIKNYEVTFSTSPTFASGNTTYLTGSSTTLTVGGLNGGTTYYARVRAVDTAGSPSAAWSATDTKATGAAGIGISSTAVTYQVGSSGTTAPTGTWTSSVPSVPAGQFLWTRTITTFTDTSTSTAYSVAAAGTNGTNGTNGIGITGTVVEYQVGASGTVAPVGSWLSSVPSVPAGQYLWTRTTTSYTSGAPTVAYAVAYAGTNGTNGSNGTSATNVIVGNDAVAIPVTAAGAALSAGTITIPFSGWVGNVRTAATITPGTLPAGITVQSNTAATSGADGSLVLAYSAGATIGAADGGTITLTVTCNSLTFTNIFTWARAYQGATGGTGSAGTSATSLDTTPDNIVIPTDASGNALAAGSVVVKLTGLVGATASNVTIGTAPTLPAGVTATPAGSGTTSAQITFSWSAGANIGGAASSGSFVWPIVVNGITFNKTLGWARATSGAQGPTGPAGGASDGQVPGAGQTPDIMTGLGYLYVKWAPTTVNALGAAQNDVVTYEVHLSTTTGFTPSAGTKVTEVSGLSSVIDHLPGTTTALTYGTTYYVKIVPKDRDGSGAASAQGSGSPSKVASGDVTSIGADLIVPGTGFVNALVVAATGSLQSSNYSANTAGWKISNTGIEMNDTNSKIKADAIITGNLGGPAGVNSVLTIASNTSLVLNGGHLKSNTYNGSGGVTYDPNATAGFYLGNDGLVIAQGKVKAEALSGGTFNAGTITIASGGKIQGGSWYIDNTGVFVPDGAIVATKLMMQQGQNIVPPVYSDFEAAPAVYQTFPPTSQTAVTIAQGGIILGARSDVPARFGSSHFTAYMGNTNVVNPIVYLGKSVTDYNIPIEGGKNYIFSGYFWCLGGVATNAQLKVKWSNGTVTALSTGAGQVSSATLAAGGSASSATRLSGYASAPAGVTGAVLLIESSTLTAGAGWSVDGVQAEVKESYDWTPSPWTPGTSTTIYGGQITTGAIASTNPALDFNGNPISGVQAWQINVNGNAVFGDALVRGKLVMGITGDLENSISTGTDDDGNNYIYEDFTKLAGIGSMQSYNYKPGEAGWSIRSNGYAEFLQLKANSISADAISAISPDKLNPGTMTADLIIGTAVRAVEKDTLYVTNKARTGAVVTLTLATPHTRLVGDRIQVKLDTPDANIDTPGKVFAIISAIDSVNGLWLSYTHPSGGSVTVGSTAATGSVYVEGRSVLMSPDGITLFQNDGIQRIIDLPTDTLLPAYFAGDVEANSLSVKDDFLLQGIDNAVAAGGVFTLNASVVAPSGTPTLNFSWDYVSTWMTNDYTAWKSGLFWEAGANRYVTTNAFFGAAALGTNVDGSFNFNLGIADDASPNNDGNNPYGVVKIAGKFYVLTNDSSDGLWKIRRYAASGTGFSTLESTVTYNRASTMGCTATEWKVDGWNGSALKDPVIGTDGTDVYIARCAKNGKIWVARYDANMAFISEVATNITDNQNLKGLNVGTFDFSGIRYVISTEGNSAKTATNYVTSTAGTHQTTETFPSPNNSKIWGVAHNGTAFVTLGQNNRLYTHTSLAKTGGNVWYSKATWFDGNNSRTMNVNAVSGNGTTSTVTTSGAHGYVAGDVVYITGTLATALNGAYYTIVTTPLTTTFTVSSSYSGSVGVGGTATNEWETALGSFATATITRRAKLTITAGSIPLGAGSNVPDRARFYFSNVSGGAGTYYRQTNSNASSTQVFTTDPVFSGSTGPQTAFPAGTPAKIVSNNGLLEISSDGFMRTDRLVLQSTRDASNAVGNLPPLMIGNAAGAHMRIDSNEIIAMANAGPTQANLYANPGGTTIIYNLNVSNTVTSDLTITGAVLATQRVQTDTGLFDTNYATSGTTTAQYNTNGRVIKSASSKRYKTNIEPMSLEMAKTTLAIEPVTYEWIDKETYGEGRYPGVIAEQAHEVGAYPWVNYRSDLGENGELVPDGFRYGEVTAAHNILIKDLYAEIEALKAEVRNLKS